MKVLIGLRFLVCFHFFYHSIISIQNGQLIDIVNRILFDFTCGSRCLRETQVCKLEAYHLRRNLSLGSIFCFNTSNFQRVLSW